MSESFREEQARDEAVVEESVSEGERQTISDRLVSTTPWWGISLGGHLVFLLLAAFITMSATAQEDDAEVIIRPFKDEKIEMPKPEPPKNILEYSKKFLDVPNQTRDPVVIKADESDHVESKDNEPSKQRKGDSNDFMSDKPFQGPSTCDSIGGGGGGGGKFGGRLGGEKDLALKIGGGDPNTEGGVLAALKWLARHQHADGHWGVVSYASECGKVEDYAGSCTPNPGDDGHDGGVTGLSLLAFLGAGYYHGSKDIAYDNVTFGNVVKKGLQWIISRQDAEGCLAPRRGEYMYDHLLGALALSEAYGLSGSDLFKGAAQKAVDFTVAAQNDGRGWRYTYKSGDNDSSVTGWAAMVLKSAELSGLAFPRSAYDGAKAWFDQATGQDGYYPVAYVTDQFGKPHFGRVSAPWMGNFSHHDSMTAIAIMSRIFIDKNSNDNKIKGGISLLVQDLPSWNGNEIDFYYWYYASLALFQYDGPNGPMWSRWNGKMKDALVKNQNGKSMGDKYGSWEPIDRWSPKGGRVYATAINCLTLEVYYRYPSVIGGNKGEASK